MPIKWRITAETIETVLQPVVLRIVRVVVRVPVVIVIIIVVEVVLVVVVAPQPAKIYKTHCWVLGENCSQPDQPGKYFS